MSDGFVSASQLLSATTHCNVNHDEPVATSSSAYDVQTDHCQSSITSMRDSTNFEVSSKKRKLHLNSQQCMDLTNTEQGSFALTKPFRVKKSSRDASSGLYPRQHQTVALKRNSFVSAGDILHPASAYLRQFQSVGSSRTKCSRQNRKKLPIQSNSITDYFGKSKIVSSDISINVEKSASEHYTDIAQDIAKCTETKAPGSSLPEDDALHINLSDNELLDEKTTTKISTSTLSSTCPPVVTDTYYGLLGTDMENDDSDFDEMYVDHTLKLPLEVIENILCRLPLTDLCLNVNRVCRRWNQVISSKKFIFWKKRYHRLKNGSQEETAIMAQILVDNGVNTIDTYLPGLIRYMKDFKPVTASNVLCYLRNHPRYRWAKDMLLERFPECCISNEPNAWSVVTSLVVLSEKVHHIQMISWCLLHAESKCTVIDVLECLYCIASFLLTFKKMKRSDVWTGMHYRLYYALYLYENSCVSTCDQLSSVFTGRIGQQCIIKYSVSQCSIRLTHEQMRICNHNLQPGELIKIIAFAGTGKTTTLVRYAQLRPDWKFLLVVYNKSVCDHAETKFPSNVTCRTGHSLGFQAVGRRYSAVKQLGNLSIATLIDVLPKRKGISIYVQAKFVLETLSRFTACAEREVTTAHVPLLQQNEDGSVQEIEHGMRMSLAADAALVWRKMQDLRETKVMMTHDGYLKLYQLQAPKLRGYDVILIDEAQDLTPAISDILLSQQCAKILVGDPHQQIYAFRGAVNTIQNMAASHTFYLTQSFRFGPEIAFVAATCLELLKNEQKKTLVGNSLPGGILGDSVGQVAVITRTNFVLFGEAVKKCCYSNENIRVAFAGGIDRFGFDKLEDIYNLLLPPQTRGVIHTSFLRKFSNLGELERYATKVRDVELLGKIKIVKTYTTSLPSLVSKIRSKAIRNMDTADVVFSTAHKAKGLEFNTVKLTDDFCVCLQQQPGGPPLPEDEANLLYVAVSRAKKRLHLTPTLVKLLRNAGERFFYPVHSEQLHKQSVPFKCLFTEEEWKPCALTLARKTLAVEQIEQKGGLISPKVISQEIDSLRHLLGEKYNNGTSNDNTQNEEGYNIDLFSEDEHFG